MRLKGGFPLLCLVEVVTTNPGGRAGNDSLKAGAGWNNITAVTDSTRLGLVLFVDEATLDNTVLHSSARGLEYSSTCRMHLHSPQVKLDPLELKKTSGRRCQEGMLYTTPQYLGLKLLQSQ